MFSEPEITIKRSRYDIESFKVGENESDHTQHWGVCV